VRFLADMGVGMNVVRELRAGGHDAIHLRDEGLQRLPDPDIFAKAIAEDRIVLTFDLDFADIVAAAGSTSASVIIFRLRNARAEHVSERLSAALAAAISALKSGAIVMVEESRVRIRAFPIRHAASQ
jgi:predicted nuclease of predicted toxin-antitoxin system